MCVVFVCVVCVWMCGVCMCVVCSGGGGGGVYLCVKTDKQDSRVSTEACLGD